MGRIRTIKPEFTQSEDLAALAAETHLLAAGLLCYADDYGYFKANPDLVKSAIFPTRHTNLTVPEMLESLQKIGWILLGTGTDGKRYGRVAKFTEHQRVNRPSPSKIAALAITWDSVSAHGGLTEDSLEERKGKERKGSECEDSVNLSAYEILHETSLEGSDGEVLEIVKAYPTLTHLQMETEIPTILCNYVIRGIRRDGGSKVLSGVRAYAASLESKKFAMNPENFFKTFLYCQYVEDSKPKTEWKRVGA